MISYRDMTFCPFFEDCIKQERCDRCLTAEVQRRADKWWGKGEAPICVFSEKPECWEKLK